MNDQHFVLTPEKAVVSYRLAGLGSRMLAHLLDVVILYMIINIFSFVSIAFALMGLEELSMGLMIFMIVATVFLYFILQEAFWNGFTIGKKAMGIKVVSADGTPVTLRGAAFRNLMRIADFMGVYVVGLVAMFLNERSQRLGDLVAGTLVIHVPRANPQFQPTPHRYGLHPFEDTVGKLDNMSIEEYFAIKRLCDRFPQLPPTVQVRSIEEIWKPFAAKEGILPVENVHPIYQMEAVVFKYGRQKKLF